MGEWIATASEAEALAVLKQALAASKVSLPDDPLLTAELLSLKARQTPAGEEIYTSTGERPTRALAVAKTVKAVK